MHLEYDLVILQIHTLWSPLNPYSLNWSNSNENITFHNCSKLYKVCFLIKFIISPTKWSNSNQNISFQISVLCSALSSRPQNQNNRGPPVKSSHFSAFCLLFSSSQLRIHGPTWDVSPIYRHLPFSS